MAGFRKTAVTLEIIDALALDAPLIASTRLPHRDRAGTHGTWLPA